MKRIMITAMQSGSGKTVVTMAILRALQRRGLQPEGFKCGPDYIDPMFQRRVLGLPCRNLDIFLQGESGVKETLSDQHGEVAVLEGAMGFYDGIGGTEHGSAWHVSEITQTPAVLVLRASGAALTLAAQVQGVVHFRRNRITGILLNGCSEGQKEYLKPILERECGIPVLGFLPRMKEAELESRHLGLVTADEVSDFEERIDRIAEALEKSADLDRLLSLCAESEPRSCPNSERIARCRIAVARDAAFCFYYEDNFRLLEEVGAQLCFFSPINDPCIPENSDGLYLGGGYPELYAAELQKNESMRKSVCSAIENKMPAVAECGGFLYLQQSLAGQKMTGVLPGEGFETGRLQRFGYETLRAENDSMLFRAGEEVPAHEFHYWDSTDNGSDLTAAKQNGRKWRCAFAGESLYAGFPHLHFGGLLPLAERFADATENFRNHKKKERQI